MLVTATDIEQWANRRDVQGMLPRLLRRLIHATVPCIRRIGFPADEGVQMSGWDGILEVERGNEHVPDGVSAWELSSAKSIRQKADADYTKRSANPLGITRSESSFVFVTPRRWKQKTQWATNRNMEEAWRDVRALDADDLEEWLEAAPAVHTWLSVHLGKRPLGAIDGESYWCDWSGATNPEISPEFVLAGREDTLDNIRRWIDEPSRPLALRAESRAEATAVFLAATQSLDPTHRIAVLARVVVVHDSDSWNKLAAANQRLTLIQQFYNAEACGRALQSGHSVVVPLGRADGDSPNVVHIPRLPKEKAAKALITMGVAEQLASTYAEIARRSLTSLRRRLAHEPAVVQPTWARPKNARALLPGLFAGKWSDAVEGDREAIGVLAGNSYQHAKETFVRWSHEDDPPIRCVGSTWYLTSPADAWDLIGRHVTDDDLDQFERIALRVLGAPNPTLDLPFNKRWAANIIRARDQHSDLLRTGIATTLAIMGSRGDAIQVTGDVSLPRLAAHCVRRLLSTSDWKVWASLPLSLIAEAAPREFLKACERAIHRGQPLLSSLFAQEDNDNVFSFAPHVDLLFALETLAWCPDHMPRATLALAALAAADPGGRIGNRPQGSLDAVFLPWCPQTTASLDQRLRVLDMLREKTPEIAWKTMVRSLPKFHDHCHPSAKPHWREWVPDNRMRVSQPEYEKAVHQTVGRVLDDAGFDGARYADILEALPQLPSEDFLKAARRLEQLEPSRLSSASLDRIWQTLRNLVSMHRSYPEADWALPRERVDDLAKLLKRFEPREVLSRFGWLFANDPRPSEGEADDWETNERAIIDQQNEAVQTMCKEAGLGWVSQFCEKVERPDLVGSALARADENGQWESDLLRDNLKPDAANKLKLTRGFIHQKTREHGVEWAKKHLESHDSTWSSSQRAQFCLSLPFNAQTWDIVERLDSETVQVYWQDAQPTYVHSADIEYGVRRLLDHNNVDVAIDALCLHSRSPKLPFGLVAEALERLLRQPEGHASVDRHLAHRIGSLLNALAKSDEIEDARVATLEWAYLPTLGRHFYSPERLHRELARNPAFFAEIVRMVFRAEGENPHTTSEQDALRARHGFELLESWRSLPGTDDSGTLDSDAIRSWVLKARAILQAERRLAVGDRALGQTFSGSPSGDDSAWPHPAIRDLIEELQSDDFDQGLVIGLLNSEGVVCRDPNAGGRRERNVAKQYERYAQTVGDRWVRTAAILRAIRDEYLDRAREEDQSAELNADLGP